MNRSLVLTAAVIGSVAFGVAAAPESDAARESSAHVTRLEKTWQPVQVINALRRAGLPIGRVKYFTAENDVNKLLGRPGQYTGKANFRDTRVRSGAGFDVENGGSVETFANKREATSRYRYVDAITKSSSLLVEYHYLEGTVFLRLSSDLTPRQAKEYERAFRSAV
jgi:hypothetical protein